MGRPEIDNPRPIQDKEICQQNPVCISVCACILVSLLLNSAKNLYFECIEDSELPAADSSPDRKITRQTWKDGFFLEDKSSEVQEKKKYLKVDDLKGLSKLSLQPQFVSATERLRHFQFRPQLYGPMMT